MVSGFRRSLSFSSPNPTRPSYAGQPFHVRSISLPCRSHPSISHLSAELTAFRATWAEPHSPRQTSACLFDGLTRLRNLHHSLADVLHLPHARESLRRRPLFIENLLEALLRLVDAFETFQTLILAAKQDQLAAQVAVRKRDDSRITSYVRSHMRLAKEIGNLVSAVRCVGRFAVPPSDTDTDTEAEIFGILKGVIELTVVISVAVFNGMRVSGELRRSWWVGYRKLWRKKAEVAEGIEEFEGVVGAEGLVWGLRRKKEKKVGDEDEEEEVKRRVLMKRLGDLEECMGRIESGSERVFRSLINTRVSLLNVLTQ
ncbi:uncharacterized protein LOC131162182 [Malania oleifera]|uniref:uncharacterized protein LOC131162182 n=1 Tax=Malania oleifera TaxID=397392 RepID=UPI0025AE85A7|nr:uncharacterized protein LOC131162182 [Malania oleifera]